MIYKIDRKPHLPLTHEDADVFSRFVHRFAPLATEDELNDYVYDSRKRDEIDSQMMFALTDDHHV